MVSRRLGDAPWAPEPILGVTSGRQQRGCTAEGDPTDPAPAPRPAPPAGGSSLPHPRGAWRVDVSGGTANRGFCGPRWGAQTLAGGENRARRDTGPPLAGRPHGTGSLRTGDRRFPQEAPSLADPVYVNFGDKRGLSDVPGESSWGPEFRAGEGGTLGGGAISLLQPRRENPRPTYSL